MFLRNCLLEKEGKYVLFVTVSSAMVRFASITVTFLFATIFKHLCSTPGTSCGRKGRGSELYGCPKQQSPKDSKLNILNGKCDLFLLNFKLLR
jgi:hypothetical protein